MDKKKIVLSLLYDNEVEISLINNVVNSFELNKKDKHQLMSTFHRSRRNVIERAKNYYKFEDLFIKNFLYLSYLQFSIMQPEDKEVYRIVHFTNTYGLESSGLISSLIPLCNLKQLEIIISNKRGLKQIHLFKVIKRSLQLGCEKLWEDNKQNIIEPEKRIKLELIRKYYSHEGISLRNVEKAFSTLSESYFTDYTQIIPSFDEIFTSEQQLFDLRYDKRAQRTLYKNVIRALIRKEPFSFMRISDGESYAFTDCPRLSKRQEIHWWGEELPLELRQEIKKEFNDNLSLKYDVLGIPSPYKFLHYVDFKNNSTIDLSSDLETKVVNRLAFVTHEIINKVESEEISADFFTEDQINNVVFNEKSINKMVKNSSRLIVISGYKAEYIKEKIHHNNIIVKEIPTHSLLTGKGETVKSLRPLPFVYKETLSWIQDNVQPGDLCLISAGFIGKFFIGKALSKGAVSLDVGQSLKVFF